MGTSNKEINAKIKEFDHRIKMARLERSIEKAQNLERELAEWITHLNASRDALKVDPNILKMINRHRLMQWTKEISSIVEERKAIDKRAQSEVARLKEKPYKITEEGMKDLKNLEIELRRDGVQLQSTLRRHMDAVKTSDRAKMEYLFLVAALRTFKEIKSKYEVSQKFPFESQLRVRIKELERQLPENIEALPIHMKTKKRLVMFNEVKEYFNEFTMPRVKVIEDQLKTAAKNADAKRVMIHSSKESLLVSKKAQEFRGAIEQDIQKEEVGKHNLINAALKNDTKLAYEKEGISWRKKIRGYSDVRTNQFNRLKDVKEYLKNPRADKLEPEEKAQLLYLALELLQSELMAEHSKRWFNKETNSKFEKAVDNEMTTLKKHFPKVLKMEQVSKKHLFSTPEAHEVAKLLKLKVDAPVLKKK